MTKLIFTTSGMYYSKRMPLKAQLIYKYANTHYSHDK